MSDKRTQDRVAWIRSWLREPDLGTVRSPGGRFLLWRNGAYYELYDNRRLRSMGPNFSLYGVRTTIENILSREATLRVGAGFE